MSHAISETDSLFNGLFFRNSAILQIDSRLNGIDKLRTQSDQSGDLLVPRGIGLIGIRTLVAQF